MGNTDGMESRITSPRQKLGYGPIGKRVWGGHAIYALREVTEAEVGNNLIGVVQTEMASSGVLTDIPAPTYGYIGEMTFTWGVIDGDLINAWVLVALGRMIYTDRRGRNRGTHSPICQIPWGIPNTYARADGT